jgi:peptidoglycan/xylan/chitin deacetylase (PgdA/CDA1 family)
MCDHGTKARARARVPAIAVAAALAALMVAFVLPVGAAPAAADDTELVPNGGVEEPGPDATTPAGWQHVAWGDVAATFSVVTAAAHGGQRAARIDVTARTDGAATFAFDPQPVTAGGRYRLSSWYRADVPTEVLAVFVRADGSPAYRWVRNAPPAAAWAQTTAVVTAPDGAVSVTVYQSITAVGFVETDDVSLTPYAPGPPPPFLGLVPNGDLEHPDELEPDRPAAWHSAEWGDHDAAFSYPATGSHRGSRAARVEISRYGSGGASWSFDPQPVAPEHDYELTAWHRSSQPIEELAVVTLADGSVRYRWLGMAAATADWSPFTGRFTTPTGAVSVTLLQSLAAVGWAEIDDVDLHPYTPATFARPLVSLTFDDGYASHATVALPELTAAGLTGTFYVQSGAIDSPPPPDYLTSGQLGALVRAGMEIGSHSVTHPILTDLTPEEQTAELGDSQQALRTLTGQSVTSFAAPFGAYDDDLITRIDGFYATHRTVDDGYNQRDTLDLSRLKAKMVVSTTTAADVQEWLDETRAQGLWLVLVFHDLVEGSTDFYDTTPETYREVMAEVAASGIAVRTVSDASAEAIPQTAR